MIKGSIKGLRALRRANKRLERKTKTATRSQVRSTTNEVKAQARRDVKRIFPKNNKVANSVRSKFYDNNRAGDAGQIFDKFGRRVGGKFQSNLAPYITGKPIRPRRGRFLAIWRGRGKRKTPKQFRGLVSIRTRGGVWLVRHTRSRTTFLFQLVRSVRPRKRLRPERYMRRAARAFPRKVQREIEAGL